MRPRILFFLFVLVPLVAIALALFAASERRAIERDVEAERGRRGRMVADVRVARARLDAIERDHEQVQAALAAATSANATSAAPQADVRTIAARQSLAAFEEAMANDPEAQNRHLAERRARFVDDYRQFGEEQGLTHAQSARLADNFLKRYERHLDLGMALRKQEPVSPDAELVRKLRQEIDDEHRSAQRELLGEEGGRALELFDRTRPAREFVRKVTTSAEVAGARLEGAQAGALLALVTEASPDFQRGETARPQSVRWDRVLTGASGFLSGPQLAALNAAAIPIWNRARLEQLARQP